MSAILLCKNRKVISKYCSFLGFPTKPPLTIKVAGNSIYSTSNEQMSSLPLVNSFSDLKNLVPQCVFFFMTTSSI